MAWVGLVVSGVALVLGLAACLAVMVFPNVLADDDGAPPRWR